MVIVCRANDDGARHHGHPEDRGRTQREGEEKINHVVPWDYRFFWGGGRGWDAKDFSRVSRQSQDFLTGNLIYVAHSLQTWAMTTCSAQCRV